jgi:hypothetical protein
LNTGYEKALAQSSGAQALLPLPGRRRAKAAAGGGPIDIAITLRMVLMLEDVDCWPQ